jgi:hypothetical protein
MDKLHCGAQLDAVREGGKVTSMVQVASQKWIDARGVCTTVEAPVCYHGLPIKRPWSPPVAHVVAAR